MPARQDGYALQIFSSYFNIVSEMYDNNLKFA